MGCSVWYEGSSYRSRIRVEFRSYHRPLFLRQEIMLTAEPITDNDEFRRRELRRDKVVKRRWGLLRRLNRYESVSLTVTHRCEDGRDVSVRAETRVEWDVLGLQRGYRDVFFDCMVFQDGHPIVMQLEGQDPDA